MLGNKEFFLEIVSESHELNLNAGLGPSLSTIMVNRYEDGSFQQVGVGAGIPLKDAVKLTHDRLLFV